MDSKVPVSMVFQLTYNSTPFIAWIRGAIVLLATMLVKHWLGKDPIISWDLLAYVAAGSVIAYIVAFAWNMATKTPFTLARRVIELESILEQQPRLSLSWLPDDPIYRFLYSVEEPHQNLMFRIKVENTSHRKSISGVRVRMVELNPPKLPCIPTCLRLMNDNILPYRERFSLNPGGHEFVDVIEQDRSDPEHLWIWHITAGIPVIVPAQPYTFTVTVDAENVEPETKHFDFFKDGIDWKLRMID